MLGGGRAQSGKYVNFCDYKYTDLPDSSGNWDEYFLKRKIYDGGELPMGDKNHPFHLITDTGTGSLWIDEIEFGLLPST